MGFFDVIRSLFIPQTRLPVLHSLFEGEPEQARYERPLPTTSRTRWYQRDVESAIHNADSGDLKLAAQLCRALRRDGTLGGILSTRSSGLARLPKKFRGTRAVCELMEGTDDVGLFDRIHSPKELALFEADGILLGVAVGEYLYFPDRVEPMFVRLDPEFLKYRWSEDRWYYQSVAGQLPITPGDGRWVLHQPGGFQSPWQNGLWASLARAYVAKDHAFNYRENYSGHLANPARAAYTPNGAADQQRVGFLKKLIAWGTNTTIELPPGWDVKLLESNGIGYKVFQETIESSDKEFMISLAGQIVTITGGAGFANADIHATIRSDIIQDDGDGLASTLNEQGLRQIVNYMFGAGARCRVAWDTKPPADLNMEATAMTSASTAITSCNAALAQYDLKVDGAEMATRFKIPVVAIAPIADAEFEELSPDDLNDAPTPPALPQGPGVAKSPTLSLVKSPEVAA